MYIRVRCKFAAVIRRVNTPEYLTDISSSRHISGASDGAKDGMKTGFSPELVPSRTALSF